MRRFLWCAGIALIAGILSLPGQAAEKKDPPPKDPPKKTSPEEAKFKKLDKDKDGKLSKKELFGAKVAGLAESFFVRADKDKDDALTLEEYKEFLALVKKGDN